MTMRDPVLAPLDALVGQWTMHARPSGDAPWLPGEGRVGFEWLDGERFLIQRWSVEVPEAPDGIAIIGVGEWPGSLRQHYFDSRGVHRIYEMSLVDGVWELWRDVADPFPQRFLGRFSEDGATIAGRWEKLQGDAWETDFELGYRRAG
jgi:hypothetical protein